MVSVEEKNKCLVVVTMCTIVITVKRQFPRLLVKIDNKKDILDILCFISIKTKSKARETERDRSDFKNLKQTAG
jgi:hypothetical protein